MLNGSVSPRAAAGLLQTLTKVLLVIAFLMASRGFFALFSSNNSFNPFASGQFTFWDNLIQAWGTSITTLIAAILAWSGAVYFNHVADMRDRERSSAKYADAGPPAVPGRRDAAAPPAGQAAALQAAPQPSAEEIMFSSPDAGMSGSPLFGDAPQRTPGAPPVPGDRPGGAAADSGGDALSAMPSPVEVEKPPTVRQGRGDGRDRPDRSEPGRERPRDDVARRERARPAGGGKKDAAKRTRSGESDQPRRRPDGEKRRPAEGAERKRRPPAEGERPRRPAAREGERPARRRDGGGRSEGDRGRRQRPAGERPPRRRPPEDR